VDAVSITYDGMVTGLGRPTAQRRVQAPSRPVRLTRRGRLVVVLVLLVTLVIGFSIGVSSQAAGPSRPHHVPTVTVQPGETLWQVAVRVAPDADPRLVVDQLQRINHLSSATVLAGQQLVVPST
jgi:hypothetical protein